MCLVRFLKVSETKFLRRNDPVRSSEVAQIRGRLSCNYFPKSYTYGRINLMFSNSTNALSGELTDLLSYLEATFYLETRQPADSNVKMDDFLRWAKQHLSDTRPSEVFPVDNNYGVLLTNGQRIKLCPDVEGQGGGHGDMANPDMSIPVTTMRGNK